MACMGNQEWALSVSRLYTHPGQHNLQDNNQQLNVLEGIQELTERHDENWDSECDE